MTEKFKVGDRVKYNSVKIFGEGTILEYGPVTCLVAFDIKNNILHDGDLGKEYENRCWNCTTKDLVLINSIKIKEIKWRC